MAALTCGSRFFIISLEPTGKYIFLALICEQNYMRSNGMSDTSDVNIVFLIKSSCARILDLTSKYGNSIVDLHSNVDFQEMASMRIFWIGSYINELSTAFKKQHSSIRWDNIIDIAYVIGHSYSSLSRDYLWHIIVNDIPRLSDFCEMFISQHDEPELLESILQRSNPSVIP
ncbi:MAG: hypothetical protein LBR80_16690 [Deltaproteobacteria bacterium]|jgi:uncharacterized protein with HEPN domain|nr:hypothetical protein [Deltaproteobacteria bacterium]